MSEGPMAAVSCVTILTLVLVSFANLILLISMIMESRKQCNSDTEIAEDFRFNGGGSNNRRYSHLLSPKNQQHEDPKFMAALTLVKYNKLVLVCGTTIISRFWVLTTAQCCETVKIYATERIKIVSNSKQWKFGIKHDIVSIMRNSNFTRSDRDQVLTHNVCLIKVRSPFGGQLFERPVALASSRYKYEVDTLATTLGWRLKKFAAVSDQLYTLQMNLISFERCKTLLENSNRKIDETMICAYPVETIYCNYDSGGPLVQNNVVIGIASFETDCSRVRTPRVFTRMSYFEKWFEQIEKQNYLKFEINFKP